MLLVSYSFGFMLFYVNFPIYFSIAVYYLDAIILFVHKLITTGLYDFGDLLSIQFLLPWIPSRIDQVPLSDYPDVTCYE